MLHTKSAEWVFDAETQTYKLTLASYAEVRDEMLLAMARDREGKLRRALIDLGWTPPLVEKGLE